MARRSLLNFVIPSQDASLPSVSPRTVNIHLRDLAAILTTLAHLQFSGSITGGLQSNLVIYRRIIPAAVTFPPNMAGSACAAAVAATGTVIFSLQQNGVQFGTMTFAASGTATFSSTEADFIAGDELTIVHPVTVDATLEGLTWGLAITL